MRTVLSFAHILTLYGLHMCPRGTLNATLNWGTKRGMFQVRARFGKWEIRKCMKMISKRCPNGWGYFRGGASWGTFGAPVCFFVTKSASKVLQKLPHGCKTYSTSGAKVVKVTPKSHGRAHFMTGPGGLREVLKSNITRTTWGVSREQLQQYPRNLRNPQGTRKEYLRNGWGMGKEYLRNAWLIPMRDAKNL